ncbi:MAG: hypothetical protein F4Y08_06720 [Caldilineaceae bacterium SB0662_bin_9]|uniref:Antitoxin FitA-like ribbon-helix-helix domain-containing protein n=1 Tax=Caldilineaceae bacterium SB0662_bin_9 TaxID=2605258 RepID=A0A6B1DRX0_9CHLR|nr:hypothetical protein [Caldilineaceae bacterium SB0662_bin_9]
MGNLQIKNISDDLHERLRLHANEDHCSMSAIVLAAVERELARRDWQKHLAQRPKTNLDVEASALLMEERSMNNKEQ